MPSNHSPRLSPSWISPIPAHPRHSVDAWSMLTYCSAPRRAIANSASTTRNQSSMPPRRIPRSRLCCPPGWLARRIWNIASTRRGPAVMLQTGRDARMSSTRRSPRRSAPLTCIGMLLTIPPWPPWSSISLSLSACWGTILRLLSRYAPQSTWIGSTDSATMPQATMRSWRSGRGTVAPPLAAWKIFQRAR
jgi:hypothetical protein